MMRWTARPRRAGWGQALGREAPAAREGVAEDGAVCSTRMTNETASVTRPTHDPHPHANPPSDMINLGYLALRDTAAMPKHHGQSR
jgi:hypothetical protein